MQIILIAVMLIAAQIASAAPTSAPTTAPSTETLLGGKITFTPPPAWDLRGKIDNGKTVSYKLEPDKAALAITVNEQEVALDEAAAQMTLA